MKITIKEALKFLFPEYQIIETIKSEGFIAKKDKISEPNNLTQNVQLNMTQLQGNNKPIEYTPTPVINDSLRDTASVHIQLMPKKLLNLIFQMIDLTI